MYSKYCYLEINSNVEDFLYGTLGDVYISFLYVTFMLARASTVVNGKMWVIAKGQVKAHIIEIERSLNGKFSWEDTEWREVIHWWSSNIMLLERKNINNYIMKKLKMTASLATWAFCWLMFSQHLKGLLFQATFPLLFSKPTPQHGFLWPKYSNGDLASLNAMRKDSLHQSSSLRAYMLSSRLKVPLNLVLSMISLLF